MGLLMGALAGGGAMAGFGFLAKRSLNPGFAGEDNPLFYAPNTMMVFGDAKVTVTALNHLLKQSAEREQLGVGVAAALSAS
jgi:hypothetical protein